jgi:hypothetical protein
MDEQTRKARELDALEIIAAELENLRILKEHELGGPGPLVLPAGAKRGRSPPPPDVAADPKPGMIAKTRGPLSVKDHSFAVYARCLLVLQLVAESSRALLISPLQERPGFPLAHSGVLVLSDRGYAGCFCRKCYN